MKNCVIYCTVPNEFNANLIATTLVEDNLAACVNILPSVTSVYKWEGIVQNDNELLLIIKTQEDKFSEIENKKDIFVKNVLYQLKQQGIESGIKAVVSKEKPNALSKLQSTERIETPDGELFEYNKISPGSTPFVPAVAGYYMAYSVVEHFLSKA